MNPVEIIHNNYVVGRRAQILASHLSNLLPNNISVLDVGCGDGQIAATILKQRPDITIDGVDVLVRPASAISIKAFDGTNIPYNDNSVDVTMFVDVLHHTSDPAILLSEAVRVSKRGVLLKDHLCENQLDNITLTFMDWAGNARHGVALPYNYWKRSQWENAFSKLNLKLEIWSSKLSLYPFWANWVFGRELHFIAFLKK